MQTYFFNLLFLFFLSFNFLYDAHVFKNENTKITTSYQQTELLDQIAAALKTGSSKELMKNSFDPIEIGLMDKKQSYSSAQAEIIMKNFFAKYPATNFEYIHRGASQDGLFYVIGQYTHKAGAFQVYILIKTSGGHTKIDTMDFSVE